MPIDPESLYRQLGQLVAEMPEGLAGPGSVTPEMYRWLGRVGALVEMSGNVYDTAVVTVSSDGLEGSLRVTNAHAIVTALHRSLARAEANAPSAARGAFIPVGAEFDVFQAIGKVLGEATKDALIIDPYLDEKVLTDFALLAAEGVALRLLSDISTVKASLHPATSRWVQQHGKARPLEVRLTAPRVLHDRLILLDGERVWSLTQSLKDFAGRSPASIVRVDGDTARMKLDAYARIWAGAAPLERPSAR